MRRQGPKELLHHLPALLLCRPSVTAHPTETLSGMLGSRLLDRRPPHYRCPAVPGLKTSARAILMAPNSSVHSLIAGTAGDATCSVACHSATLRQPAPVRLSCICSGLEPHCRTSRCARPQPTPSPRYHSLTSLLGTANCTYTTATAYCSRRPLITAGHPVRLSVPSPSCNNPGSGTPPPHRPAHCNYGLLPGSSCLPGPLSLWPTRETITTPLPNVYSSQHRFSACPTGR